MKKFWENYKFSFTLLLGIFVGALIGVVMGEKATALEPIGQIFLNLMFTIVVPMVFVSIASSVGSIKEYSGKLSAFCGCAIAAGTGMACGLVLLRGGSTKTMAHTINNLASSITGMICDGGNQGCTMKGIVAVDAAWQAVSLAEKQAYIYNVHGINGATPEQTMRNMGLIASPGMVGTEKTIVEILQDKQAKE